MWRNIREELPEFNKQINISIKGKIYIGYLTAENVLQVSGYTASGIDLTKILWTEIPELPKSST